MSNRLTLEFAVRVGNSTIRELQASRRELLVQLAHKLTSRLGRKPKNEARRRFTRLKNVLSVQVVFWRPIRAAQEIAPELSAKPEIMANVLVNAVIVHLKS